MNSEIIRVFAPLSGTVLPLEEVPDEVFSQKVLGDGLAIIPEDGKIYSPVNGEIASVAETKHAYGFTSEDGLEVLVHFGLDTVALKGEGFTSHVSEGDSVKVGDLIAEVDLSLLEKNGIRTITPVLVCDGADGKQMETVYGQVKAGLTEIIALKDEAATEQPAPVQTVSE